MCWESDKMMDIKTKFVVIFLLCVLDFYSLAQGLNLGKFFFNFIVFIVFLTKYRDCNMFVLFFLTDDINFVLKVYREPTFPKCQLNVNIA